MVRLNITMPENAIARLEALAFDDQKSKSAIMEKALTLYELAHNASKEGKTLAILGSNGEADTEIVGL
jgi:hypothetical protein